MFRVKRISKLRDCRRVFFGRERSPLGLHHLRQGLPLFRTHGLPLHSRQHTNSSPRSALGHSWPGITHSSQLLTVGARKSVAEGSFRSSRPVIVIFKKLNRGGEDLLTTCVAKVVIERLYAVLRDYDALVRDVDHPIPMPKHYSTIVAPQARTSCAHHRPSGIWGHAKCGQHHFAARRNQRHP